jgi:hypothetical protein
MCNQIVPAQAQIHLRSLAHQPIRPPWGTVCLRHRVPGQVGSLMNTGSAFTQRSLTARNISGNRSGLGITPRSSSAIVPPGSYGRDQSRDDLAAGAPIDPITDPMYHLHFLTSCAENWVYLVIGFTGVHVRTLSVGNRMCASGGDGIAAAWRNFPRRPSPGGNSPRSVAELNEPDYQRRAAMTVAFDRRIATRASGIGTSASERRTAGACLTNSLNPTVQWCGWFASAAFA